MSTITAQATGNYSAPGTWAGGVVPNNIGDIAQTGAFVVTIDVDLNLGSGTLKRQTTGRFEVSTARTIVANIQDTSAGQAGVETLKCTHASGTVAITGNLSFTSTSGTGRAVVDNTSSGDVTITGNVNGFGNVSLDGARNSGTGTLTITGSVTAGNGGNGAVNSLSGTLTVNGNVAGSGAGGASSSGVLNSGAGTANINGNVTANVQFGVTNNSNGTVNITGTVTGSATNGQSTGAVNSGSGTTTINGNVVGGAAAAGASNTGAGTLVITGNSTGGSVGVGSTNTGAGTLSVQGAAIGNNYGPGGTHSTAAFGVNGSNTAGSVTKVRKVQFGAYGMSPTSGSVKIEPVAATNTATMIRSDNSSSLALTDPADAADFPAVGNVRLGTVYKNGTMTGTLAVPAAGSVALGVAVDAGLGTAVLTPTAVTDAVWDGIRVDHQDDGSYGKTSEWASSAGIDAQGVADALKLAPSAGVPAAGSGYALLADIQGDTNDIAIDTEALAGQIADARDAVIEEIETHGDLAWLTATGFATQTDVADARDHIENHGDDAWPTATGFATPEDLEAAVTPAINAALAGATVFTEGSVPDGTEDWYLRQFDDVSFLKTLPVEWVPETYTAVIFTAKTSQGQPDSHSLFQLRLNREGGDDGLLRLNGAALPEDIEPEMAGITVVDEDARLVRFSFSDEVMALLVPRDGIYWSCKVIDGDGNSVTKLAGSKGQILYNATEATS